MKDRSWGCSVTKTCLKNTTTDAGFQARAPPRTKAAHAKGSPARQAEASKSAVVKDQSVVDNGSVEAMNTMILRKLARESFLCEGAPKKVVIPEELLHERKVSAIEILREARSTTISCKCGTQGGNEIYSTYHNLQNSSMYTDGGIQEDATYSSQGGKAPASFGSLLSRVGLENRKGIAAPEEVVFHGLNRSEKQPQARISHVPAMDPSQLETSKAASECQGAMSQSSSERERALISPAKVASTTKVSALSKKETMTTQEDTREKDCTSVCVAGPREESAKERSKHVSWGKESVMSIASNGDSFCEENTKDLLYEDELTEGAKVQSPGAKIGAAAARRQSLQPSKLKSFMHSAVQMLGAPESSFSTSSPVRRLSASNLTEASACEGWTPGYPASATSSTPDESQNKVLTPQINGQTEVTPSSPFNMLNQGLHSREEDGNSVVRAPEIVQQIDFGCDCKEPTMSLIKGRLYFTREERKMGAAAKSQGTAWAEEGETEARTQVPDAWRLQWHDNGGGGDLVRGGAREEGKGEDASLKTEEEAAATQVHWKLRELMEREKTKEEEEDEDEKLHGLLRTRRSVKEFDCLEELTRSLGRQNDNKQERKNTGSGTPEPHVAGGGDLGILQVHQKLRAHVGAEGGATAQALRSQKLITSGANGLEGSQDVSSREDRKTDPASMRRKRTQVKMLERLHVKADSTKRTSHGYHDHSCQYVTAGDCRDAQAEGNNMSLQGPMRSPSRAKITENFLDPAGPCFSPGILLPQRRATALINGSGDSSIGLDMEAARNELEYLLDFLRTKKELREKARANAAAVQSEALVQELLAGMRISHASSSTSPAALMSFLLPAGTLMGSSYGEGQDPHDPVNESSVGLRAVDKRRVEKNGRGAISVVESENLVRGLIAQLMLNRSSPQAFPMQPDGMDLEDNSYGGHGSTASCGCSANAEAAVRKAEHCGHGSGHHEGGGDATGDATLWQHSVNKAVQTERSANTLASKIQRRAEGPRASEFCPTGSDRRTFGSGSPLADVWVGADAENDNGNLRDDDGTPEDDNVQHHLVEKKVQTQSPASSKYEKPSEAQRRVNRRPPFVSPSSSTISPPWQQTIAASGSKEMICEGGCYGQSEVHEVATDACPAETRLHTKNTTKTSSKMVAHPVAHLAAPHCRTLTERRKFDQPHPSLQHEKGQTSKEVTAMESGEVVRVGCHSYVVAGGSWIKKETAQETLLSGWPATPSDDARRSFEGPSTDGVEASSGKKKKAGRKMAPSETSSSAPCDLLLQTPAKRCARARSSPPHHRSPDHYLQTKATKSPNRPSPSSPGRQQQAPRSPCGAKQGAAMASPHRRSTPVRKGSNKSSTKVASTAKAADGEKALREFPAGISGVVVQESIALAKDSDDPYADFRDSMLEMMEEKNLCEMQDLQDLLQCFLHLNQPVHHSLIQQAFSDVCCLR